MREMRNKGDCSKDVREHRRNETGERESENQIYRCERGSGEGGREDCKLRREMGRTEISERKEDEQKRGRGKGGEKEEKGKGCKEKRSKKGSRKGRGRRR